MTEDVGSLNARSKTKAALLEAAMEAFAAKGYRETKVADICKAAETNVASVNYHYGSKEALFAAVMRRATDLAEEKYPVRKVSSENLPARERLAKVMGFVIARGLDPGPAGFFDRIMAHSGTRNDAPPEAVFSEAHACARSLLDEVIFEIAPQASEAEVEQARMNIIALCVFPKIAGRVSQHLFPGIPSPDELQGYIDRQVRFAERGLASLEKVDPIAQ